MNLCHPKEMMMESDRWEANRGEISQDITGYHSVAVEHRRDDLVHIRRTASNLFQGIKIKTTLARATQFPV